jgi:hypothetical protein
MVWIMQNESIEIDRQVLNLYGSNVVSTTLEKLISDWSARAALTLAC